MSSHFILRIKNVFFHQSNMERFQRLGKEFFWIILGQAFSMAGAIIGVRILTEFLPPKIYGELALGITITTFVGQIVMGPLGAGPGRFFAAARENNELGSFLKGIKKLILKTTGIILLFAFLIVLFLIIINKKDWIGLIMAAFCFALLSGYNSILNSMQVAARQRLIVAWHQALATWARFIFACGMIIWFGSKSSIAMLGYSLAILMVLISQYWFFRRKILINNKSYCLNSSHIWEDKMLSFSWPFATWGIFTWAQSASDRWALQKFASTKDVGIYSVLYQLGYYPITVFIDLTTQLLQPIFYQRVGDASDKTRLKNIHELNRKIVIFSLFLTFIGVFFALFFNKQIFKYLVAEDYRQISWLLPGMVMASGFFATAQIAAIYLLSDKDSKSLILPKIGSSIIGIILNISGAFLFGVKGVVGSCIIFSIIYLVWVLYAIRIKNKLL